MYWVYIFKHIPTRVRNVWCANDDGGSLIFLTRSKLNIILILIIIYVSIKIHRYAFPKLISWLCHKKRVINLDGTVRLYGMPGQLQVFSATLSRIWWLFVVPYIVRLFSSLVALCRTVYSRTLLTQLLFQSKL